MGTPGVSSNFTKEDICSALKECKGVVTHSAIKLKVNRSTLDRYIRQFGLEKELKEFREQHDEEMLDEAENVLKYALSVRKDDLGNSLKSAFYLLNNKGKRRGFAHPMSLDEGLGKKMDMLDSFMGKQKIKGAGADAQA
jgi:hypothetical protein